MTSSRMHHDAGGPGGPAVEDLLIERARTGDRDAFGELVRRHEGQVRRYLARILGDLHAADDVAQDVFVAAYQGLDTYRGEVAFRSWLLATAHHKATSLLRSLARRRTQPVADVEATLSTGRLQAAESARADPADAGRIDEALARCINRLPEKSRRYVERHYHQGESAEVIARALGKSGGAVRMTLLRIRTALNECIRRRVARAGDSP